jgi:hypothetical protein
MSMSMGELWASTEGATFGEGRKKEDGNRPKGCASCAVAVLTILGFIAGIAMQLKSF